LEKASTSKEEKEERIVNLPAKEEGVPLMLLIVCGRKKVITQKRRGRRWPLSSHYLMPKENEKGGNFNGFAEVGEEERKNLLS